MSSKKGVPNSLYTVAEASELTGISKNGIRIAIRTGRLHAKEHSFGYLIPKFALDAWKPRRKKDG